MKFKNILDKSLDWLKHFGLNFFHNGYARSGAKRSTLNVLWGVLVAFVLICGGLTIGYNTSFDDHYEKAVKFRQFAYSALSDAGLSVSGGRLASSEVVDTLSDKESPYRVNGYELVIDTRPVDSTYDDFEIVCSDGKGGEISYAEFLKLESGEKSGYSLRLKYSGKTLDTALKQDEYRAHLDGVSVKDGENYNETVANAYAAIKEKEADGSLSGYALYNEVYKLYAKSYYPSFEKVESYASVPTVRSYYISKLSENGYGKYLVLFDEYCLFSFYTEDGVVISFSGRYLDACNVSGESGVDALLLGAFDDSASLNFIVFASDMMISVIIFVIGALIVSFILAGFFKKAGLEYTTSTGIFNIIGGFLPVSGLVAFIFGIALPYFATVQTAYLVVRLIFVAVVAVRFAVLAVMDTVNKKKNKTSAPAAVPQPVPADPFEDTAETENSAETEDKTE